MRVKAGCDRFLGSRTQEIAATINTSTTLNKYKGFTLCQMCPCLQIPISLPLRIQAAKRFYVSRIKGPEGVFF